MVQRIQSENSSFGGDQADSSLSSLLSKAAVDTSCESKLQCSGEEGEISCPPGVFCVSGYCECLSKYPNGLIRCNDYNTRSSILRRFCATYDNTSNSISVGICFHGAFSEGYNTNDSTVMLYHKLPRNASDLQRIFCEPLKRCGNCLSNHSLSAYSYSVRCISCMNTGYKNWISYILVAYFPLTLFYIFILFFKINTTSSYLFAVVFSCQTITMPLGLRSLLYVLQSKSMVSYTIIAKVLISLHGIWNLDFFRPFFSNLCLGIGVLDIMILDYFVALYPFVLTIISYLLVLLYNRNYRIITIMWRPFRYIFTLLRRNWDIKTSLIDAYATFFFLSNMKLLNVCFSFLIPTNVHHIHQNNSRKTLNLYLAGHIEYFGSEHLPYAIVAITVLLVFFVLPITLLALYPFKCFHRCLNLFSAKWYILHTFVDSFQGCYKDGTEQGTRDYRWFVSVFFWLRLIDFIFYTISDIFVSIILSAMLALFLTTLIAILQPFKSSYNNKINIAFLNVIILFCVTLTAINSTPYLAPQFTGFFYVLGAILASIPLFYTLAIILHWFYISNKFGLVIIKHLKKRRSGNSTSANLNESLPDRINNSADYPRTNLAYLALNSVSK